MQQAVAPRVSVIVRSMNRASLGRALAAIAQQDYPDLEVVLVAAIGAAHPVPDAMCGPFPVRFVASDVPLPRADAANAGLDAATGDWITFLDDDDAIAPDHVSGLVAALSDAGGARVVYSRARGMLRDGRTKLFGQPFSLMQLYDRNFIHLSTALVDRTLLAEGCRFDSTLEILEDWDFMLQLAHRTRFQFVPRQTFEWHADLGDSGAGGGVNQDDVRFASHRDRIYAKWAGARDALSDRVRDTLQAAAGAAQRGDLAAAAAACRDVLRDSQNDPWALNTLAMIERRSGQHAQARRTQELAVAVRDDDADLVYNLALVCRDLGDLPAARAHGARAAALAPDNTRYRVFAATIAAPTANA
ncbi:MAG: glycosyltransferase [Burkholderiales bacterium]